VAGRDGSGVREAVMTRARIEKAQAAANLPFELAKQIRQLLDEAKKAGGYTADDWAEVEQKVLELVSEES